MSCPQAASPSRPGASPEKSGGISTAFLTGRLEPDGSIVYLAAITSIDSTLYEAASIDGATWWKKVWHVTLPGIRTTIVLMAVMNLGNILNAGFDQVYNLYSASVYATGDILDTYVYRVGLQGLQYSFGTAVGLLKSVIAFVLMIGANKLAQKYTDSKIF